jgi:hypothetical protein
VSIFNWCRSKWNNYGTLHELLINDYFQVDMTFGACVAYLVDVMHSRSSEVLATMESVLFSFFIIRFEFKD